MLEKILHFLKETPAWVVLAPLFMLVLCMTYFGKFNNDASMTFLQRVTDGTLGALLLSLNTRRSGQTVNAETIETPTFNTNSMDGGEVNTETRQHGE